MTYVSWAALYEGPSDAAYLNILIPRIMDEAILNCGVRHSVIPEVPAVLLKRGDADAVAKEICDNGDAFYLVFIHADTGGRGLVRSLEARSTAYCAAAHALCAFPPERCIAVAPKHEIEAWLLCDAAAVCGALGYRNNPTTIGLPASAQEAEGLVDPKASLQAAMAKARGRRRQDPAASLYPAIAQRQSLAALRTAPSFKLFEDSLLMGLTHLGCL
jgi:hypothetical protein